MVRKSQQRKAARRDQSSQGHVDRHYIDKRKGIVLQRVVISDERGEVAGYSLAYIDPTIHMGDNGRVLGYDNRHGYHHRHFKGRVEAIEFESFEALERRFEQEVRELYDENHGRNRKR